jgi:hypothetical protein
MDVGVSFKMIIILAGHVDIIVIKKFMGWKR